MALPSPAFGFGSLAILGAGVELWKLERLLPIWEVSQDGCAQVVSVLFLRCSFLRSLSLDLCRRAHRYQQFSVLCNVAVWASVLNVCAPDEPCGLLAVLSGGGSQNGSAQVLSVSVLLDRCLYLVIFLALPCPIFIMILSAVLLLSWSYYRLRSGTDLLRAVPGCCRSCLYAGGLGGRLRHLETKSPSAFPPSIVLLSTLIIYLAPLN